jgi:hypothetical protein
VARRRHANAGEFVRDDFFRCNVVSDANHL